MITLEDDTLAFRFSEVHEEAGTEIRFVRTLRIPDDGKTYPLPAGIAAFPLQHLDDFAQRVPEGWRERGGVMMPLYRAEAMWISFGGRDYPCAVKIAAGRINAVSGKPWKPELDASENDYVVVPEQPWLDGFCIAKDTIRQFVAMPLGAGYSVEEQLTGKAEHGGLQIVVYPMKKERYEALRREREAAAAEWAGLAAACPIDAAPGGGIREYAEFQDAFACAEAAPASAMALAAGGRMEQQIYADPYGLDAWDQSVSSRCFVTLVDAVQWMKVTGRAPPTVPPSAADYAAAGLPWFDYYAADLETLAGAPELALVKSVAEIAEEKGDAPLDAGGGEIDLADVIELVPRPVREAGV